MEIYLFIWLHWVLVVACKILVVACGTWFPDQGSNPRPLHWERGILATRPQGSLSSLISFLFGIHSPRKYQTCAATPRKKPAEKQREEWVTFHQDLRE